jgi:Ner family transcriptional regulator
MQVQDWHPKDILKHLEMKGLTLTKLAKKHGCNPSTFRNVMRIPYLKVEQIIANELGIPANQIWASRYQKRDMKKCG